MSDLPADTLWCDICDAPMIMAGEKGRQVHSVCTNIQCKQSWGRVEGLGISCTILKHLWPSNLKEGDPGFREQYLPEWLKKIRHDAQLRFVGGFWDQAARDEQVRKSQEVYDNWFLNHPAVVHPPQRI
jgi:hypothetical protein